LAMPERRISPVSRFPLPNETLGTAPFSRILPYAKCRIVLFSGVTATCLPVCAFVFRKIIPSAVGDVSVVIAYSYLLLFDTIRSPA
jgi:hypothetical protein